MKQESNFKVILVKLKAGIAKGLAYVLVMPSFANASQDIPYVEFNARRQEVMKRLPDGILLVHSKSTVFNTDQILTHGFHQDPTFYYLSGLPSAVSSILAINGIDGKAILFVPRTLSGPVGILSLAGIQRDAQTQETLMLDGIIPWEEFAPYLDAQISANPSAKFYVEGTATSIMVQPPPESNPPGLGPVADPLLLWQRSLAERWPDVPIVSAYDVLSSMYLVKSPREIAIIREAAKHSAAALLAGIRGVRPLRRQREVEVDVVRECFARGSDGLSVWPFIASGPNSYVWKMLDAFVDYRRQDRTMQPGEVVHIDVGCEVNHYAGDVGRTVPVSGRFSDEQRDVWNLLIEMYRGGLEVMRAGVSQENIIEAAMDAARRFKSAMKTPVGQELLDNVLAGDGAATLYLHSTGIEPALPAKSVLEKDTVVVWEPYISLENQSYFLEDMILIKEDGYEILTEGLPYSAEEIEKLMGRRGKFQGEKHAH